MGNHRWLVGVSSIMVSGALLGVSGCRTADLSKGAQSVSAGRNPPPQTCKSLGYLTGRGGGTFGGAYITNDKLVEYALNDLRNQAAELGANYVQHDPPAMGSGDGTTTTVTVTGTAYQCAKNELPGSTGVPPAPAPAETAAEPAPGGCNPPCSPGFACESGSCTPQCNPACGPDQVCDEQRVCQPKPGSQPPPSPPESPPESPASEPPSRGGL